MFHTFKVLIYVIQNQNFVNFDKTLYFIITHLAGIPIWKTVAMIRYAVILLIRIKMDLRKLS